MNEKHDHATEKCVTQYKTSPPPPPPPPPPPLHSSLTFPHWSSFTSPVAMLATACMWWAMLCYQLVALASLLHSRLPLLVRSLVSGVGCAVFCAGCGVWEDSAVKFRAIWMVGVSRVEIFFSAHACMCMCMCARRVPAEAGMWRMIHAGMQLVKRCGRDLEDVN